MNVQDVKTGSMFGLNPADELNDLRMSEKAMPLLDHVKRFIAETVEPMSEDFTRLGEGHTERWTFAPGQLEVLEVAKSKAKAEGLWNFFLPDAETGVGLSNLDYAYIAVELGKSPLASETMNCAAPDTGNMEVLERVGTAEQKARWLTPLLNGEIRSAYAMTEPNVASSDAKNISTTAVLDGGDWVINGEKYYISGAGDPRCKIMIVMVKTSPEASPHQQQSQILVPMDTPGIKVLRMLPVFGYDDAPHGHAEVLLEDVRVPVEDSLILGEGRGFEISQARLGPGRIHHCMRTIGTAEVALEKMCKRLMSRKAFGKYISEHSVWEQRVAAARADIEMNRLLCLKAADMMDKAGNKTARLEISMIKVTAPNMALRIIDDAIQAHGGGGVTSDFGLAKMYASQRTLRLADGPDEVHNRTIARMEFAKYGDLHARIRAERDAERVPVGMR